MTGGLLQLKFKSGFSNKLIGNPSISHYNIVYKKHTNFSIESYNIQLKNKLLEEDSINSANNRIHIPRYGDLLTDICFKFTLPNIYSGCYNENANTPDLNNIPYEFKWVENIGTNIITKAKFIIDTSIVNEISGELMDVLSEINYDDSKKKIYDKMIGNVPEVYNPTIKNKDNRENFIAVVTSHIDNAFDTNTLPTTETVPNYLLTTYNKHDTVNGIIPAIHVLYNDSLFSGEKNDDDKLKTVTIEKYGDFLKDHYRSKIMNSNGTANTPVGDILILYSNYPHMRGTPTTQGNIYDLFTHKTITKNSDVNINNRESMIPSIKKRKCRVPLPFYFSRNPGLAIPLIALQKSPVYVDIELNKIKNLYTVLNLSDGDGDNLVDGPLSYADDLQPEVAADLTRKVFRVKPWTDLNINTFLETQKLDLEMELECTYVYLEEAERRRFSQSTHEYLIEEYQEISFNDITSDKEILVNSLNYPVKELIVVSQRSDMKLINNWNNYSNWTIDNVAPYSYEYHNYNNMYIDKDTSKYLYYNKHNNNTINTKSVLDMKYCHQNIIDNISFIFNGTTREVKRDNEYFNVYQPFKYHKKNIKNGIHVYSFSLKPNEYQPSGFCDFSSIDSVHMKLDLGLNNEKEIPKDSSGKNLFKYNFRLYAINYNFLIIQSGQGSTQFGN